MTTVERAHAPTSQAAAPIAYRSILPVDFSPHSGAALRYADALTRRFNGELTVLHAFDPMLASAAAVALGDQSMVERSTDELRRFVHGAVRPRGEAAAPVVCLTQIARAADGILSTAEKLHSDVIVMGTQGTSGFSRMMLGSITRQVLTRTTIPVLAIPQADRHGFDESWPGDRIIAALDLTARTPDVARRAAEIARAFRATLVLAYVAKGVRGRIANPDLSTGHERISLGTARAALTAVAHDLLEVYPIVETRVVAGEPADELAALRYSERAGLVITVSREPQPPWLVEPRSDLISRADACLGTCSRGTAAIRLLVRRRAVASTPLAGTTGRGRFGRRFDSMAVKAV